MTETFILNEILELARQGTSVRLFALSHNRESVQHPGVERVEATYLAPASIRGATAALAAIGRHPLKAASLVVSIAHACWRQPKYLAKNLYAAFAGAQLAGALAKEQGLRHIHAHWATYPTTAALESSIIRLSP
jgi:hypothetical protein